MFHQETFPRARGISVAPRLTEPPGCASVRECRLKSDALRLTIGEVDGEEPVRAIETLELHLATLGELDS